MISESTDQAFFLNELLSPLERIDSIEQGVKLAMLGPEGSEVAEDRRKTPRHPYPYPFYITPLGPDGTPIVAETFSVIGSQITPFGIDFYHTQPIPHRLVVASLPYGDEQWIGLQLNLSWCRFNRFGWYDNGGKFIRIVDAPVYLLEEQSLPRPISPPAQARSRIKPTTDLRAKSAI